MCCIHCCCCQYLSKAVAKVVVCVVIIAVVVGVASFCLFLDRPLDCVAVQILVPLETRDLKNGKLNE